MYICIKKMLAGAKPSSVFLSACALLAGGAQGVSVSTAQNAPKYSNAFMDIGAGARGLAMSGNQSSNVSGANSVYWNPAGLCASEGKHDFSLMHAAYFAGIANYDFAAFATRIDSNSVFGAGFVRLGIDDIADTRFLIDADGRIDYNKVTSFAVADYAFMLSYGRKHKKIKNLSYGATAKIIYRDYGLFSTAWGFGLDAGAQYISKHINIGLNLRDVTGTFNAWSHNPELVKDVFFQTGNTVPENTMEITLPKAMLDASRYFRFGKNAGALLSAGGAIAFDGPRNVLLNAGRVSFAPSAGTELDWKKTVFIRGGIGNFQKIKGFDQTYTTAYQPNFGIGLRIKQLSVDYALTDIGDKSESLYSNVFSLAFRLDENFSFKKKPKAPETGQ